MARSALTDWALKVLGFMPGFVLAIALEFLLFWLVSEIFGHRFYPRGLGWFAIPFTAGVGGAVLLSSLRQDQIARLFGGSREMRLYVAGGASWLLLVSGYVFVAEPFGSYISDSEWMTIFKWMFVPPVLALVVRRLFRWANKKDTDQLYPRMVASPTAVAPAVPEETAPPDDACDKGQIPGQIQQRRRPTSTNCRAGSTR
ncbi:hypothetical protein P7L75_27955 [Tistrella mobilis]|uniref:hypothetical protein n=1 Tax=Tistrella mobilis TaxID=171437 RepID=UPI00355672EC